MNKPHVIIHPYDLGQADMVRIVLPFLNFLGPNEFQIAPSITRFPCLNKDTLKGVRAVILQKPTAQGRANLALAYSKLKKECGFKLVTDIDDLMWDLSPIIAEYAKNIPNHDKLMQQSLKQTLPLFDTVVCSTRFLARRIKQDLNVNAIVMPNGVSKALFGNSKRTVAFNKKPKVMYAGSLGHFTNDIIGDFCSPWETWVRRNIEQEKIDFYIFGEPKFLSDMKGKFTSIPYTSTMDFPATAKAYAPDFYLAPLANNNFNKAKSDLKLKEAAALGAVFLGSDFADSPYSYAPIEQLIKENCTVDELDSKFNALCEPKNYMAAINWQYTAMNEKHWLLEDNEYQKRFVNAYCSAI